MSAYHLVETLIVGAAVAGSSYGALLRFAPGLLGRKTVKSAGGCSSCDSCGSCATPTKPPEQTVQWHRS